MTERTESAWVHSQTAAETARAERRALLADYFVTFTTPHGQRVLEDLRKSAGVYRTEPIYDREGRIDPYRVVLLEGPRLFVAKIEQHLRDALAGPPDAPTHAVSSTATKDP